MSRATSALYLVGTPIGNLGDLTLRAVETLKLVDRIAAEDTRRTRALLAHLGIAKKPLVHLDAHADERKIQSLVERVAGGENVAFVTDAGMPGVSDPGGALVRMATEVGVNVTVIPGPSAVTTAVALSGLVEAPFSFAGFLPRQGGKRREALARIAETADPVVLFEAPNRTHKTLSDLSALMPQREVAACRELTKLHEEVVRGTLGELAAQPREWRGEIVIVLGSTTTQKTDLPSDDEVDERIAELLESGASTKDATAALAAWSGRPKRELYARVELARRG